MPQPTQLLSHLFALDFPDGWGGVNNDWPPDLLYPHQLSAAWNVYHFGPELRKRGGEFREVFVSAGASIVAGFDAQFSTGAKIILQTDNGRFWQTSANMTSAAAMGTSAFGQPAAFAQLGDIVGIATGGTLLGASGTDGVFALGDSLTPSAARYIISYKNRFFADNGADSVMWSAVGATTGLPTPMDWTTAGNAAAGVGLSFTQGEGEGTLIGLATDRNQWYAFKRRRTYRVNGGTPSEFEVVQSDREAGLHHRSIAPVGRGLIGANEDGLYTLIDGKIQPLIPNRLRQYWRNSVKLPALSSFFGAWVPSLDQYRLAYQTSGGVFLTLYGVMEPAKEVAWYFSSQPSRALFSRLVPVSGYYDFYRGGNADGYLLHMDQGTADASAGIVASAETKIYSHYLLHRSSLTYIPEQSFMDKNWERAWVFCRTSAAGVSVSADATVHAEIGKFSPTTGSRRVGLDPSSSDVKRYTMALDGFTGWGISFKFTFPSAAAGSVHKVIVKYNDVQEGVQGAAG